MNIALIRGDFANHWEIQSLYSLSKRHNITLFTGYFPLSDFSNINWLTVRRLVSPVDINFGSILRPIMSIINRIFVDAHVLFGLENQLKNFDVAYCAETYYSYTNQALDARRKGYIRKVVSLVFENIAFNNEGIWMRRRRKQRAIREIDTFIVPTSLSAKALIAEGCDPGKIVRATPGVDLDHFRRIKLIGKIGVIRQIRGIRLLVVSRLVEEKGIAELVSIFRRMQKKYPALQLTVVGTGPLETELHDDGITHLPKVPYDQMPEIYRQHDIFVHYPKGSKTWQEQFGFVLAEAMACGLPVVGLDRGSVKEVVGPGGLIVPARKYYSALESLIKSKTKREKLAKAALIFARKTYDAKKYGQTLEKIFLSA